MAQEKKNAALGIAVVALAIGAIALGYYLYQDQQSETVSVSFGDNSISATIN